MPTWCLYTLVIDWLHSQIKCHRFRNLQLPCSNKSQILTLYISLKKNKIKKISQSVTLHFESFAFFLFFFKLKSFQCMQMQWMEQRHNNQTNANKLHLHTKMLLERTKHWIYVITLYVHINFFMFSLTVIHTASNHLHQKATVFVGFPLKPVLSGLIMLCTLSWLETISLQRTMSKQI